MASSRSEDESGSTSFRTRRSSRARNEGSRRLSRTRSRTCAGRQPTSSSSLMARTSSRRATPPRIGFRGRGWDWQMAGSDPDLRPTMTVRDGVIARTGHLDETGARAWTTRPPRRRIRRDVDRREHAATSTGTTTRSAGSSHRFATTRRRSSRASRRVARISSSSRSRRYERVQPPRPWPAARRQPRCATKRGTRATACPTARSRSAASSRSRSKAATTPAGWA